VIGGGGVFHLVGHGRGRASAIELKELMRDYMSQSMDHGVQDDSYCDRARGRGRSNKGGMNGGPAYCTIELY
jgi:hypothetical protein